MVTATAKKQQTISAIITARRNRALDRQGYWSLLLRILFLALAGWVMFTQVFLITQVSGNAMFPAVKDGDLVIAFRIQQEYANAVAWGEEMERKYEELKKELKPGGQFFWLKAEEEAL